MVMGRVMPAVLGLAGILSLGRVAPAQQLDVESTPGDGAITVRTSADLRAGTGAVWAVITDYDHLADFIPDMIHSRVIERTGDRVLVSQAGEFRFLFFRQPVEVRLMVVESPQREIVARAVGGNLKAMEGRYTLGALPGGGVRLSYSGRMIPGFAIPPFIGRVVLRNEIEKQFAAVVKEIRRREALAHPPPAPAPER